MNEFLRKFIMQGIRNMIANDVELYKTYQYASGWYEKNVLTQEDLIEIETLYAEKEAQKESEEVEEVPEENVTIDEATETIEVPNEGVIE